MDPNPRAAVLADILQATMQGGQCVRKNENRVNDSQATAYQSASKSLDARKQDRREPSPTVEG